MVSNIILRKKGMTTIPMEKFHKNSNGKLSFSTKDLNIYHMGSSIQYLTAFNTINRNSSCASYKDLVFLKMKANFMYSS